MVRRSASLVPPQIPDTTPRSRAYARHGSRTGQAAQIRFGLVDLIQRGPDRGDGEEQVRIGVEAGSVIAPVGTSGHRTPTFPMSADDAQGEQRWAAVVDQLGNLVPVQAIGVGLRQRGGDP